MSCTFKTDKGVITYAFGFLDGDDVHGHYQEVAEVRDATPIQWPEHHGPGWGYKIDPDNAWTFFPVDDLRRRIVFKDRIGARTGVDFTAFMTDANGDTWRGGCEVNSGIADWKLQVRPPTEARMAKGAVR